MKFRPALLLTVILIAAVAAGWLLVRHRGPLPPFTDPKNPPAGPPAIPANGLSELAPAPDWSTLNLYQSTVTRSDFLRLMDEVFTVSPAWRNWFEVSETDVVIRTDPANATPFRLRFAPEGLQSPPARKWRPATALPPAPRERPLEGLKIAIDPGHIGGRWAKMEERWFQLGDGVPVAEGDMTLQVAQLLKPKLEALGARVSLVRETNEPVTEMRPELLRQRTDGDDIHAAERLFYRTAEIRARARVVNEILQPDLVLCLHFNADSWGNPNRPSLAAGHHFHLIVNGGYTDSEVALADQRYELTRKLLEGIHGEETALAESMAATFVERTGLPAYTYNPAARTSRNIAGNPYIWARNLLANRLYDRPVVFLEPYVMNSREDYERIQAGDYEGLRRIGGRDQPSIFREYADAVALGLERYYREKRTFR